ncbi:MAG: hypothetical protein WCJ31_09130 [Planctomycetia bacterium]
MKALAQSQAARRRAAAAAIASVGAGILGTQSAEAGIVTINLASAGSNLVDITGVNAGLTYGNNKSVTNFPISSGGILGVANQNFMKGVTFEVGGKLAIDGGYASPHNFAAGAVIGSSSTFDDYGKYTTFQFSTAFSLAFGNNSYLGFKTSQGNYGWIKATWNGTNTFQLYSAAYESVAGVSIKAGDSGAAVPEIDPSGLASAMSLVMGSVAMLEQRRRKRAAVAAESAAVTA